MDGLPLPLARPTGQLQVALEHLRHAVHPPVSQGRPPPESTGNAPGRSLSMPPSSTSRCASPTGHSPSDSIQKYTKGENPS